MSLYIVSWKPQKNVAMRIFVSDFQAFADQGVNLANVTSITLGLGNRANPVAGGSGVMYFDDIRLYATIP